MADDTPKKEPEAKVDWEKRYKDEQTKISELAGEKKVLADELAKSQETVKAIEPFIDWDAATGTPQEKEGLTIEDLDKKISKVVSDSSDAQAWSDFKHDNPELKGHEALVLSFVQKSTGTRDERLGKAKKLATDYIESLRAEGKKAALDQNDETARKEAEVAGLDPKATPPSDEKPVTTEESNVNYINERKAASSKAHGY